MKCFLLLIAVLLCGTTPLRAAGDQTSTDQRLKQPEIVQKYLSAIKQTSTLAAAITRIDEDADPDTAYFARRRPNQCKLVSRVKGLVVASLVSDGKTLYQWNDKLSFKQSAPQQLSDISPFLPLGQSALIGADLLNHPEYVGAISDWRDAGAVILNKVPVRKVVSEKAQMTLWLGTASGLPTQFSIAEGKTQAVFRFRYTGLGSSITDKDFEELPPDGLTLYQPPNDAGLLPPGTPAPAFILSTLGGTSVTLSKLRGQNVLIDFWASWCPPCRISMPHVQHIYADLASHGVTVLSINTSDTQDSMQAFLAAHPDYTTTMLFDPNPKTSNVAHHYLVTGIPTIYLIDREGKVASSFVGYTSQEEAKIRFALAYSGVR